MLQEQKSFAKEKKKEETWGDWEEERSCKLGPVYRHKGDKIIFIILATTWEQLISSSFELLCAFFSRLLSCLCL